MKSTTEKLDYLFNKYEHLTAGTFHNTLWQIMINNIFKGKEAAFVFIHGLTNKPNIGIAVMNVGGYIPTTFSLKYGTSVSERDQMLRELNREVFGVTGEKALEIEMNSYKQQNIENTWFTK